jgi:FG-GAP repeat
MNALAVAVLRFAFCRSTRKRSLFALAFGLGLLGLLSLTPLRAQELLQDYQGQNSFERFGRSGALLGDLDGDGFMDILVGTDANRVDLISGATATTIRSHSGAPGEDYGFALVALGDVDGDGADDYAIGAPELGNVGTGFVELISGATGAVLHTFVGAQLQDKFGACLARVADLDFDGRDDLFIGSPAAQNGTFEVGRAELFSSATGQRIWLFDGLAQNDNFGTAVADVGDVDGDGFTDLGVGAPGANQMPGGFLSGTGAVTVFSGFTGATLMTLVGDAADDLFGSSLAAIGDLDQDGKADFAVGAPGVDLAGLPNAGRLRLISGAFGFTFFDRDGVSAQQRYAARLAPGGDWDNDGRPEVQVGSPNDSALVPGGGSLEVYSPLSDQVLERHEGAVVFGQLGQSLLPTFDADGDGLSELAIAQPGAPSPSIAQGRIDLRSPRPFLGPAARGSVESSPGVADPILFVAGSSGGSSHRVEVAAGQSFALEMRTPALDITTRPFALFGAAVLPRLADSVEDPAVGSLAFIPCPLLPGAQPLLFTVIDGIFGSPCATLGNSAQTPWLQTVAGLPAGLRIALQGIVQHADGSFATSNGLLLTID